MKFYRQAGIRMQPAKRGRLLPLLLLWLSAAPGLATLLAQPPAAVTARRPSRIITTKDGLPQSFISGLVQDEEGFVWIGTRNGLARYDGIRFKTYPHGTNNASSLASNIITSLFKDAKSRIWIQYESGDIDVLNPRTETISHVTARAPFRASPGRFVVRGLLADAGGNLWGIQKGNGFYQWDLARHTITHYARRTHGLPSDTVRGLLEDRHGTLWIVSQRSISGLDRRSGRLTHTPLPAPLNFSTGKGSEAEVVAVHERGNGEIMFGDRDQLIFFHPARRTFRTLALPHPAEFGVHWIQTGPNGQEYLESWGRVYRYGDAQGLQPIGELRFEVFRDAQSFLVDHSGLLWLGTNAQGIHQFDLTTPFFEAHAYTHAFHQDLLGQEWGIPLAQAAGWPLADKYFRISSYLFRSAYDAKERLWMALRDKAGYYDAQTRRWVLLPPVPGISFPENLPLGIRGISFDPDGRLWMVADNGYVASFDPVARQWVAFTEPATIRQTISPGTIPLDIRVEAGQVWLTTEKEGLLRIDRQHKTIRRITQSTHPRALPTDQLLGFENDPTRPDLLWIGSYEGLICLDKKSLTSRFFSTDEGLPDNTVYSVVADRQGYLWLSTNKGLCRFHPVTHQVRVFQTEEGLPGNEFNRFHHLRLPDGRLAFGGTEGWVLFDPAQLEEDRFHPPVAFTGLKINNVPVHYGTGDSLLPAPLNSLPELVLPHDQNSLTFEFAGLQFNQPSKLSYRYRLAGYDNGWIAAGNLPLANYTKLPPGRYALQVNATNTSGQWSRHVKALPLRIKPPLWATWWAYTLYGLLAAGLGYGFLRIRLNRERLRHAMSLKEQEAEHLRTATEWKTRFFANITHEFRTPLTLIVSPLEQLMAQAAPPEAETLRQQHRVMHRNAQRLLQLINQLLDVSKLEAGRMTVSESRGDVAAFLGELVDSFRLLAAHKGIALTYDAQLLTGDCLFDAEKWEKIAYNLLSNALKFTPAGGTVRVGLARLASEGGPPVLQLRVEDSGIGIPADQLPHIFERFYQVDDSRTCAFDGTGIGLVLVKELTELLGGSVQAESGPGRGTAFTVTLPVHEPEGTLGNVLPAPLPAAPLPPTVPERYAAEGHTDSTPAALSPGTPLVLVVEDHDELRDFITGGLSGQYRVLTARNGREGWLLAQQELPDLVISDVMMPGMDGFSLCEHIRNTPLTTHIAVILLTAKTAPESRVQGLSAGANDYLPKPFNLRELQLRVANWLSYQQQLRQFWQERLGRPQAEEPPAPPAGPPAQDPFLLAFYELLDGQLANPALTIEQLAQAMRVSTRTLHRKLSALTGMNTTELLRAYRLGKAATFLQEGCAVSEAAYKTGFENLSYFSRSFKAQFSVSPSQYSLSHSQP